MATGGWRWLMRTAGLQIASQQGRMVFGQWLLAAERPQIVHERLLMAGSRR